MNSAIITDIRELCNLGFDWQTVVPTLLHMLHELVPSDFNTFFWVDDKFEISNAYAEFGQLGPSMYAYMMKYYNRCEAEVRPCFSDAMRSEQGVTDWEQYYQTDAFLKSGFYREVFEPAGIRYTLRVYIPVGGRNMGLLLLNRSAASPSFSQIEKGLLKEIIPYLSTGMAQRYPFRSNERDRGPLIGSESGVLILNQNGQLLAASPCGRYLLFLVTHPTINPATIKSCCEIVVPSEFYDLHNHTTKAYKRKCMEPYTFHLQNCWGYFTFCAHLLDADTTFQQCLSVTVQRHEPLSMKLIRCMRDAPLSPGQKRICLLLLEGLRYAEIAKSLNIRPTTVRDYVYMIYRKLDVHSHQELLGKLFANQIQ